MRSLGVVMARAGSAGLPDKHLKPLLGRPVIAYTLDHARASRRLSHLVVSSDSAEVLRLARRAGIDVIERPARLATADASVQDVLLHALDAADAAGHGPFDAVATLYGNVPVRPDGVVDAALDLLERSGCDSVRSFCPVGKWHPAWMARIDGDRVRAVTPGSVHRRQDLEPLWLHDGAVVVSARSALEAARARRDDPHAFFGDDRRAVVTEPGATIEIDHLRDLYWAEAALRESSERRPGARRAAS